jgi:hypothetical protein
MMRSTQTGDALPVAGNSSDNTVALRDERGRYLKGMGGGPGRPVGSRNKLSEDFLGDLHQSWQQYGAAVLDVLRQEDPVSYVKIVASVVRVDRVELARPGEFERPKTREEILQKFEERAGPEGRRLFEQFLRKLERLENQQVLEGARHAAREPRFPAMPR